MYTALHIIWLQDQQTAKNDIKKQKSIDTLFWYYKYLENHVISGTFVGNISAYRY